MQAAEGVAAVAAREVLRAFTVLVAAILVVVCGSLMAMAPQRAFGAETTPAAGPSATPTPTPTAEPTVTPVPKPRTIVIGRSVRKRAIKLVRFGSGSRRILIVGGIHGNEAGTPVAKAFVAYLRTHPSAVPSGTELDIVVSANPDGYAARRRGNARKVDLNRNFPTKDWRRLRFRGGWTSGRKRASEPETRALVTLMKRRYARVLSLHSRGGLTDGGGKGGVSLARRVAKKAGIRRVSMARFGSYRGSMGTYAPQRYPKSAYVIWELSSRKMTSRVKAGLLEFVR